MFESNEITLNQIDTSGVLDGNIILTVQVTDSENQLIATKSTEYIKDTFYPNSYYSSSNIQEQGTSNLDGIVIAVVVEGQDVDGTYDLDIENVESSSFANSVISMNGNIETENFDITNINQVKNVAKEIIAKDLPLFGICLGHQIIALANGISTYKMHNGHRGINHPVKNLKSGKGEITSQNHGFAINREETEANKDLSITHIHLNDNTVAGIEMKNKNCFSVQYHPEASPGPHDASYLFDQFVENISKNN